MAKETATVVVGSEWELISASNIAGLRYEIVPPASVMIYVGESAPAATLPFDPSPRRAEFGALDASKVYARTQSDRAEIKLLREVSSSNPAIVILKPLALATLTVDAGADIASTIAVLQNKTAGSTVAIKSIKGAPRSEAPGGPTRPLLFWPAFASKIRVSVVETHPKALNSGLETRFDLAVNLPVTPGAGGEVLTPPAGFKFVTFNNRAIRQNGKLIFAKVA